MCLLHLSVLILQQVRHRTVEYARSASAEGRRVLAGRYTFASSLQPHQPHIFFGHERVEHADGITTTADAGQHVIGQASFDFQQLCSCFAADDRLEVSDHHWIWVWANGAADQIMGGLHIGHPVSDGFIDGVLKSLSARVYRDHLSLK